MQKRNLKKNVNIYRGGGWLVVLYMKLPGKELLKNVCELTVEYLNIFFINL